jgi:hypothetical protein
MNRNSIAALLSIFLFGASVLQGQSQKGPEFLVDEGGCPFECCTYGKWKAEQSTKLFAEPKKGSKEVGAIRKGTQVTAVTGEVHSLPVEFIVRKKHEGYSPGDILQVYSYVGEGNFKVWINGKLGQESLAIGRGGGPTGDECRKDADCWGELKKPLDSVWWVKIKTKEGLVGWTNEPNKFSGKDSCG